MCENHHHKLKLIDIISKIDPIRESSIREFVESGGGKQLVDELIETEKSVCGDHSLDSAVEGAMGHLESYCQIDEFVGCMLMSYLRDIAADTLAHDAYDSIGLWLVSSTAEGLHAFLEKRALEEMNSGEEDTYFRDLVEIRGRSVVID